ncbi:hypothetical protein C8F01DRAFT_1091999 [Mycena amicta]|nr:hypothetical protein C8F01DRAFT_1091999 [Mycena amicta]
MEADNHQHHTNSMLPVVFYLQLSLSDIQVQDITGGSDFVPLLDNKFTPASPCRILITGACAAFSVISEKHSTQPRTSDEKDRELATVVEQAPETELRWVYEEEGENSPLVYIEYNTAARGIVTSREYNYVRWLPGHRRPPARLIEEGAVLRCWVDLCARQETADDSGTRIAAWVLEATAVTRCYRSMRHNAIRRVEQRRAPEIIDLTLTEHNAGISAARESRTDVEMIDLSLDDSE